MPSLYIIPYSVTCGVLKVYFVESRLCVMLGVHIYPEETIHT
jgi:hypothetical protein